MPPADEVFLPLATRLHQQHRLRRSCLWQFMRTDSFEIEIAKRYTVESILPKGRKPQRYKTRIRINRSIRGGQPCRRTGLPLISYSIPQLRRYSSQLPRCTRWSLQHATACILEMLNRILTRAFLVVYVSIALQSRGTRAPANVATTPVYHVIRRFPWNFHGIAIQRDNRVGYRDSFARLSTVKSELVNWRSIERFDDK